MKRCQEVFHHYNLPRIKVRKALRLLEVLLWAEEVLLMQWACLDPTLKLGLLK
jgi:hypothetical protein